MGKTTFKTKTSVSGKVRICLQCDGLTQSDCCAEVDLDDDVACNTCSCTEVSGGNTMTTSDTNQLSTSCEGGEWSIEGDEAQGNVSISTNGLVTTDGLSCGTYTASYTCDDEVAATQKIRITDNGSWGTLVELCTTGGCLNTWAIGSNCIHDDDASRYFTEHGSTGGSCVSCSGACSTAGDCTTIGAGFCDDGSPTPFGNCCSSPCGIDVKACPKGKGRTLSQAWIC